VGALKVSVRVDVPATYQFSIQPTPIAPPDVRTLKMRVSNSFRAKTFILIRDEVVLTTARPSTARRLPVAGCF
jgi:hypothetical protein